MRPPDPYSICVYSLELCYGEPKYMFGALFGPLLHLFGPNIFKLECVLDLRFGKQLVIDASHLTAVGEAMVVVGGTFS